MPALPSVPGVVKVELKWSYGLDTDVITRFFIKYSGTAPLPTQLNTFCAAVGASEATRLGPDRGSETTSLECIAVDLSSPTAATGSALLSTVGTALGTALPADASFVDSYEIVRRYRGGHSRGYWPLGTNGAILNAQQWTTGTVTAYSASLVSFFADVLAAGWALAGTLLHVNVSYYEGFTVVTNPVTGRARNVPTVRAIPLVDTVTAQIGRQRIGSQRRRLGR